MEASVAPAPEGDLIAKSKLDQSVIGDRTVEDGGKLAPEVKENDNENAQTLEQNAKNERTVEGGSDPGVTTEGSQEESLTLKIPHVKDADSKVVNIDANSLVDRPLEKALADLEKEQWYHGYLPVEDLIGLLVRDGDFLLRGLEPEGERTATACVTVKWGGTIRHYPFQYTERNNTRVFTLDGTNTGNDVMILVRFHMSTETPIKDAVLLGRPIPRRHWELTSDKIKMVQKVGSGTFGEVWWGTMREGPDKPIINIAIKLTKLIQESQALIDQMFKEARVLRQYKHRNIVTFYGVIRKDDNNAMIVLEFVPGCSLSEFLKKKQDVDIRTKVGYAIDVASGLDYLHSRNCMHRDIACRNCLINVAQNVVKLSDFGLSKQAEKYNIPENEKLPLNWQAPEVILTRVYTAKCDVYSYGILIWEIFHNAETPFKGIDNKTLRDKISDPNYRPRIDPELPVAAKKVIRTCWQADPEKRPKMTEVLLYLFKAPPDLLEPCKKKVEPPRKSANGHVGGSARSSSRRTKHRTVEAASSKSKAQITASGRSSSRARKCSDQERSKSQMVNTTGHTGSKKSAKSTRKGSQSVHSRKGSLKAKKSRSSQKINKSSSSRKKA